MLKQHLSEDIRKMTGTQPFVAQAPVNLIYVANYADLKIRDFKADKRVPAPDIEKEFNSIANAGFIAQNVYLYAASEGLATVVRSLIDRKPLAKVMKLTPDQKIILAQSVGYPKE
jgi:nitroreductase